LQLVAVPQLQAILRRGERIKASSVIQRICEALRHEELQIRKLCRAITSGRCDEFDLKRVPTAPRNLNHRAPHTALQYEPLLEITILIRNRRGETLYLKANSLFDFCTIPEEAQLTMSHVGNCVVQGDGRRSALHMDCTSESSPTT